MVYQQHTGQFFLNSSMHRYVGPRVPKVSEEYPESPFSSALSLHEILIGHVAWFIFARKSCNEAGLELISHPVPGL